MPQIKKSTPIYFKPSHETAAALAKLRERYPDKTRTAIIELAIMEHLRIVNANPGMFMLDEYHGTHGPETMVTVVHDSGPLVDEMHLLKLEHNFEAHSVSDLIKTIAANCGANLDDVYNALRNAIVNPKP